MPKVADLIFKMNALKVFVRRLGTERSMNRVTLIGRVGGDAQLRGNVDHPVVIFSIATTTGQKTEWHRVSVFKPGLRTLAENYVKSGLRVLVEGKLSYGHIIDKSGTAVPTTSIIAEDVMFLSKQIDQRDYNKDIYEDQEQTSM